MSEKEHYIDNLNFHKSFNLLYPLLGFRQNSVFKPFSTYLYWVEADYSIEDFHLLVYYKTPVDEKFKDFEKREILIKEALIACFEVEGGMLYVFDLVNFSVDIAEFIEGKYSKFKEDTKKKIMSYFGDVDIKTVRPGRPVHATLWPELYYKAVAEELGVEENNLRELGSKFDVEEETCWLPIIENKNCCKQKTFYL